MVDIFFGWPFFLCRCVAKYIGSPIWFITFFLKSCQSVKSKNMDNTGFNDFWRFFPILWCQDATGKKAEAQTQSQEHTPQALGKCRCGNILWKLSQLTQLNKASDLPWYLSATKCKFFNFVRFLQQIHSLRGSGPCGGETTSARLKLSLHGLLVSLGTWWRRWRGKDLNHRTQWQASLGFHFFTWFLTRLGFWRQRGMKYLLFFLVSLELAKSQKEVAQ